MPIPIDHPHDWSWPCPWSHGEQKRPMGRGAASESGVDGHACTYNYVLVPWVGQTAVCSACVEQGQDSLGSPMVVAGLRF